jgi:hypothetical protein
MTNLEKIESIQEFLQSAQDFLDDPATQMFPIARAEAEQGIKDAKRQILNLEKEGC